MTGPITLQFLIAVEAGARALRDKADDTDRDIAAQTPPYGASAVGQLVGLAEQDRQQADLLDGWAARYRTFHGKAIR